MRSSRRRNSFGERCTGTPARRISRRSASKENSPKRISISETELQTDLHRARRLIDERRLEIGAGRKIRIESWIPIRVEIRRSRPLLEPRHSQVEIILIDSDGLVPVRGVEYVDND